MNEVSNITEKILQDARAEAQEIMGEAKTEAEGIGREFAAQADDAAAAILAEAKAKANAAEERSQSQADMDHRKRLLAAKQEMVSGAFDSALRSLAGLSEEERALLMVKLVVKYQTSSEAELIFNKADQEAVGPAVVSSVNALYTRQQLKEVFSGGFMEQVKKLMSAQPVKKSVSLSKRVGAFAGGFILKEGDIENNCTFEILVGAVRDELEGDVSSILFQ